MRPDFLLDAWVYYKKAIARPVKAELQFDILMTGNRKKVGAEVKEVKDLFGSLPPRGRLGRQCMDMAVTCDYAYLAIMGSQDDVRTNMPKVYLDKNHDLVERTEDQLAKDEEMLLAILGDIKELGVTPLFLSRDPIMAYRTLLKYMTHDITDEPPISLLTKPFKNMYSINLLSTLPGIGWERANEIVIQFGSVFNFMHIAQQCLNQNDFTKLENIKINNRKLGKSVHKMFDIDGVWIK
jgi:hypothetical protein